MMAEWSGKIIICDRCGREYRMAFLKEKQMDGGFTVINNFEPLPNDWEYYREAGWLCPKCADSYKKLLADFLRKEVE